MHYYSFHIGDYASHTRHLSLIEDLAYRRLLDHYYMTEAPIVAGAIARLIGMGEHESDVLQVLNEYFLDTGSGFISKRADKEIASYRKQSEGGKRGAAKRWSKDTDSPPITTLKDTDSHHNANPLATINHKPITNNQKPITPTATPTGFAEFWNAYPKKVGKGAAESAWKKTKPPLETVLMALAIQTRSEQWIKDSGQFIPNPATWLNQKRWEDGAIRNSQSFDSVDYGQSGSL